MEAERRYGGLSVAQRRAARRARLAHAGLELFGERGYAATTIEALCARANVTARHFYDEFASREALLSDVFDRVAREALACVDEAINAPGRSAVAVVRDGLGAYFTHITSDPRRARLLVMEVAGVSRALEVHRRAIMTTFIAQMVAAVRRLEEAGVAPTVDVKLLSAALVGASAELTIEWVLAAEPERPPVAALVDLMSAVWIRSLQLDRHAGTLPHGYESD